jgi:hypothetical protein
VCFLVLIRGRGIGGLGGLEEEEGIGGQWWEGVVV